MYKIKYLTTGHIFLLPKIEAEKLKTQFPGEYQILEKDGKKYRDRIKKPAPKIDLNNIRELVLDKEDLWRH